MASALDDGHFGLQVRRRTSRGHIVSNHNARDYADAESFVRRNIIRRVDVIISYRHARASAWDLCRVTSSRSTFNNIRRGRPLRDHRLEIAVSPKKGHASLVIPKTGACIFGAASKAGGGAVSDNGRRGGCGQNGLPILNGWGSMFVSVHAWDFDGVTSSRDSRDMLQLGWQFPSKYLVGGFGRSAKAGWAAEGVISNFRGKGKRIGGLVLPSWGTKRVRADAWDLARVANSTETRPARQSGQPLQSQKRLRWRHANVNVPILRLGALQVGCELIGPTTAAELRGPAWVWHASIWHTSTRKWHASTWIWHASTRMWHAPTWVWHASMDIAG